MKKISFLIGIIAIIVAGLGVYSCQKNETINPEELQRKEAVAKFENSLKAKSSDIKDLATDILASRAKAFRKGVDNDEFKEKQEEKAKQTLYPLLQDSKKLLLEYGIDDEFLKEEFGDENHPAIINLGMYILHSNKNEKQKISKAGFDNLFKVNVMADSENSIFDCAMDALGIPAGLIVGSAKNLSTKAILKAARKLATRTVGWIGAGIAVYEFGDCMGYW